MSCDYISSVIPSSQTGLPEKTTVIALESIPGKKRIFTPGRRSTPREVANFHEDIVTYVIKALIENGFKIEPEKIVGISILTEGAGVPFFYSFDKVWPGKKVGGQLNVWARRKMVNGEKPVAEYEAYMNGLDKTLEKHPIEGSVGIMFDIGATGSTLRTVVSFIAPYFDKLIYSSPCTSLQAAKVFTDTAIEGGLKEENLAVVGNEGFFGLYKNGTFLSHQIEGTITSDGNLKLSKDIYPREEFCHIGAGGLAANWQGLYEEELREDEKNLGTLKKYDSIEKALEENDLIWPDSFNY